MLAATPQKAILRLLYLRSWGTQSRGDYGNLREVMQDLERLDDKIRDGHYGLSSLIGSDCLFGEDINLLELANMKMVEYGTTNPHATLTHLGRAVASLLKFPDEVEKAAEKLFNGDSI